MAFLGSLLVEIKGDNSKLDKSIKTSEKGMKGLSKSFKKTGSVTDKLKIAFKQMAGPLALGAIVFTTLKVVKEFSRLAAAAEEIESKFHVVFGNTSEDVKDWAETYSDSVGRSSSDTLDFLGSIGDLLKPLGFQKEAVDELSKVVVTLANDLGSFNDMPTADVMRDIQSAMVGNFEVTKKYGVVLNESVIKQEAFNRGLFDGKGVVDAQVKAQIALDLIIRGTNDAQGDLIKTQDSHTNTMIRLQSATKDLGIELGVAINDGLTPMAGATADLTKQLAIWLKQNRAIKDMFTDIFEGADQSTKTMEELEAIIKAGAKSAELMSKGFGDGFDQKLIDARNEAIILLGHLKKTQELEQRYAKEIAQNRTDAAAATKLEIETGDAKIASIERLEELRVDGLSTQEQELENIQTEINGLWRFRETAEVMAVINELVKRRTELNEKLNETLEDENDTIIKVSDSTALAHAEGMIGIGRQAKAVEELTMDYETLARDGLGSFVDAFAMVGEAGVTGWEIVGQAGKDAISTVLDAYAKLWSIQAIAEFAKPFGVGIPSGLGYLSAAIAAKAGSGFVQNLAEGGVLQPSSGGTPAIMAEAGVPEMALPLNSTAIVPFARAIAGEIGNNTTNNNTQNFNSTFSLNDDNQLREAARRLFPFMRDEDIRRGITI